MQIVFFNLILSIALKMKVIAQFTAYIFMTVVAGVIPGCRSFDTQVCIENYPLALCIAFLLSYGLKKVSIFRHRS